MSKSYCGFTPAETLFFDAEQLHCKTGKVIQLIHFNKK